eukprot:1196310-Prorocentrum_minimum.AAC.1
MWKAALTRRQQPARYPDNTILHQAVGPHPSCLCAPAHGSRFARGHGTAINGPPHFHHLVNQGGGVELGLAALE